MMSTQDDPYQVTDNWDSSQHDAVTNGLVTVVKQVALRVLGQQGYYELSQSIPVLWGN